MSRDVLTAAYTSLERVVRDFLRALDGIPDEDLNHWKPAAEQNGGGEMNTLAAMSVHTVQAGAWRIVHQVFDQDYPRDRESEFTATASRAEIDAMFATMLRRFAEMIEERPDIDLSAMPPTIRETSPDWTKLQYLVSLVEHTALHMGHAQITRQLWLAERGGVAAGE